MIEDRLNAGNGAAAENLRGIEVVVGGAAGAGRVFFMLDIMSALSFSLIPGALNASTTKYLF